MTNKARKKQANKRTASSGIVENRVMVQCRTEVKRDAVRRMSIDGVEHVIVSSSTLPDDIVMNGGLYPSDEIEASFETLEMTLAPVEHPTDEDGNFIPASDPRAIHGFHAGAFNTNVRREGGRVHIDKFINVAEAMKTDRGKRLLDRIDELENSDDPRPIHTSVGVFLMPEELDEPKTNAAGQEYTWIARDMVFDHDAILLDSVGAAQPHQGVGIAVNREGEKMKVCQVDIEANRVTAARNLPLAGSDREWDAAAARDRIREAAGAEDEPNATYGTYHLWFDAEDAENFSAYKLPFVDIIDGEPHAVPNALRNAASRLEQTEGPTESERERIRRIIDGYLDRLRANQDMSHSDRVDAIRDAMDRSAINLGFIEEIFDERVIFFEEGDFDALFEVPYTVDDNGIATIVGIPTRVERNVTYTPKTNQSEGDAMKDRILNKLKEAGVETEGKSDDQLIEAYNQLLANQSDESGGEDAGNDGERGAVANSEFEQTVLAKLNAMEEKFNAKEQEESDRLAEVIANSGQYPGLDKDSMKLLPLEKLQEMAANCQSVPAFGVSPVINAGTGDDQFAAPADMPE